MYDRLIDYLPLPPATEDWSLTEIPNLELTKVECLMFTFHQIARQADTFLSSDQERLRDFRSRLQYLARVVQRNLKEFLAITGSKPAKKEEVEDIKIKQIVLRTNENIQTMIQDLFHNPPIYRASIILSFKPREKLSVQPKVGDKRKPSTFSGKIDSSGAASGGKKRSGNRQPFMDTVGRKQGKAGPKSGVPVESVRPPVQYNVPQSITCPIS